MDGCRRALAGCMLAARDVVQRRSDRVRAEREPDGDRRAHAHGQRRVGVPIPFTAIGTDAGRRPADLRVELRRRRRRRPSRTRRKTFLTAATFTVDGDGLRRQGRHRHRAITAISSRPTAPRRSRPRRRRPRPASRRSPRQFAATATDPDGHAVTYAWDLDGDGTFETTEREPVAHLHQRRGQDRRRCASPTRSAASATRAVTINALPGDARPDARFNVLVFSKTAGVPPLARSTRASPRSSCSGQQNNFTVDAIEDATLFTDAFLARYDAGGLHLDHGRRAQRHPAGRVRALHPGRRRLRRHPLGDRHRVQLALVRPAGRARYFRNHPNGTPTATVVVEDATHVSTTATCRRAGRAWTSGTTSRASSTRWSTAAARTSARAATRRSTSC